MSLVGDFFVFVCFFKQTTAYEMRISDWSSDVFSSDLKPLIAVRVERSRDTRRGSARSRGISTSLDANGMGGLSRGPLFDLAIVHHDDEIAMLGEFGVVGDDQQGRAEIGRAHV